MGRRKAEKPKEPIPEEETIQVKRRFVEVSRISKHLYCSVCQEVFNDPVQGPCQHTFCKECITSWIDNHRAGSAKCPNCRQAIRKTQIKKNLLAFQLINELTIQCQNRACSWKGKLEEVTIHLPNCSYRTGKLPEWFEKYLQSREEEFQKADDAAEFLDDDIRDKLKEEEVQPLAIRLFNADQPELNAQLGKIIQATSEECADPSANALATTNAAEEESKEPAAKTQQSIKKNTLSSKESKKSWQLPSSSHEVVNQLFALQNGLDDPEDDELDDCEGLPTDMKVNDMLKDSSNDPEFNTLELQEYSAFGVEHLQVEEQMTAKDLNRKKVKSHKSTRGRKPKHYPAICRLEEMGFDYKECKQAMNAFENEEIALNYLIESSKEEKLGTEGQPVFDTARTDCGRDEHLSSAMANSSKRRKLDPMASVTTQPTAASLPLELGGPNTGAVNNQASLPTQQALITTQTSTKQSKQTK